MVAVPAVSTPTVMWPTNWASPTELMANRVVEAFSTVKMFWVVVALAIWKLHHWYLPRTGFVHSAGVEEY